MTETDATPAGPRRRTLVRALIPAALIAIYAFVPADQSGLLPGPPWQAAGGLVTVVLLAGVLLVTMFPPRTPSAWVSPLLLVLVAGRVLLASALIPLGWSSSFVLDQNGVRQRIERVGLHAEDGSVVDRRIDLSERSAAFQFLNDGVISPGGVDATRPVTLDLRWRGYMVLHEAGRVAVQAASIPPAVVAVDGRRTESAAGASTSLSAGVHEVVVDYVKPAGVVPHIQVTAHTDDGAPLQVFAVQPGDRRLPLQSGVRWALRLLDALAVFAAAAWLWPSVARMFASLRDQPSARLLDLARSPIGLATVPLIVFALQGLVAAASHADLNVFLIGDDMRLYAANGRNIALHGLLMNGGRPLFTGEPFFFYPLYPYFVALTHVLFDESFYGLVLLQFVLLGAMIAAVAWLTWQMFGHRAAWIALAILAVLAELDFVRYYTISVFTDNLYYPLVGLAVGCMWRMERATSRGIAIAAGVAGGLATLTRPSMMLVLPLYVVWRFATRVARADRSRRAEMAMFVTAWMAMVGLATLRNWLASGRFVLLAESSMQIIYCLAPPGVDFNDYMASPRPSVLQSVAGALSMFRDHPMGVFLVEARKFAFMFGFTNVMPEHRLHPEFVGLTAAYVTWLVQAGRRASYGAVVHLTVLGHVLAFLASTPAAYGYKTMLTLMILMVPFTADLLERTRQVLYGRVTAAAPVPTTF